MGLLYLYIVCVLLTVCVYIETARNEVVTLNLKFEVGKET